MQMNEFQGSSQTSSAARSNSKNSAKSASKGIVNFIYIWLFLFC